MESIGRILKYFPDLDARQRAMFDKMTEEYPQWNEKINVISRRDIDNLEIHHILHSLSIAKFISFSEGSDILDMGCGGGLPGLPLAVIFPGVHFHLIDRIGKKVRVAMEIAQSLGLENVTFQHGDIGECHGKFDFVVSRAVMPLTDLIKCVRKNISTEQRNPLPNGVITLKGGDLKDEIGKYAKITMVEQLTQWFDEEYFKEKVLTYTPLS